MIVRVRVGSETLIVGPRAEFAALAAVHAAQASALASEYEVRRRLLIALADPALAGELRRAFGRWRDEGPRLGEADDRALIDRVAQMTRNGMLAAFVVSDRSKHHGRAAAAAAERTPQPAAAAAASVAEMDLQERIVATLWLVPNHLSGATREEFLKLIEPEAIALTSGVLAVWAVSHFFGVGEIVDVLLVAAGIVLAGPQFWLGAKKLRHALELAQTATSLRELDEAAQAFADMIATLGVAVLVAAITHGAGKRAARWKEKKASLRNKPLERAPKAERLQERPGRQSARAGSSSESSAPAKSNRKSTGTSSEFERISAVAREKSVATPKSQAVFYSGPGNRKKALAAAKRGKVPIDSTECGKALDAENLYSEASNRNRANGLWSTASQRYAEGASGDVTAYVHGASPDFVFAQTELPAILDNPNVTSINGIPTQLLRSMEEKSPGAAFKAVEGMAPE